MRAPSPLARHVLAVSADGRIVGANIAGASKQPGISRNTIYRKLRRNPRGWSRLLPGPSGNPCAANEQRLTNL